MDPASTASATSSNWQDLCLVADLPVTGGKYIALNNRGLAVFRTGPDEIRVFDNACPHAGGSLAGGHIDNGCVYCPWHYWSFDVQNGEMPDNPRFKVRVYPTRIVGDKVQVDVASITPCQRGV